MDNIIKNLNLEAIKNKVCKNTGTCLEKEACESCVEAYINQDYVSQRELPIGIDSDLFDHIHLKQKQAQEELKEMRSKQLPSIEKVIAENNLTKKQQEVILSYFREGLSFGQVATKYGVSKSSIQERYVGAIKKLKNNLSRL